VVLVSLPKHTRKDFQVIIAFGLQHIYYIIITVCSYKLGAEKILSLLNIQQMSGIQKWELFIHTYVHIKSMLTSSCTTVSVERCLSRWRCY